MGNKVLPSTLLLTWSILWMVTACEQPRGIPGATDVWAKGKSISIKANFGTQASLLLSLRNDGTTRSRATPIQVTGWFRKAGKAKGEHAFPDFSPESGVVSAEYHVRNPAGERPPKKIDKSSPDIILEPGEGITITPKFWSGDIQFDTLERAQVVVGSDSAAERDVFLISMNP
jgi:hypothetical protein